MNPIKLWEYLAAGLPVVSTPVAGIEALAEHVSIATSPHAIARALDAAIETDSPDRREARRQAVQAETWSARAADAVTSLLPLLKH
jgi:hypothetical protein